MGEVPIEMYVKSSYIDDIIYLIEKEIERERNYEEIEKWFYIKEYIEEEYNEAKFKEQEGYRKTREEQTELAKFLSFLKDKKGYSFEKITELENEFGKWKWDKDDD